MSRTEPDGSPVASWQGAHLCQPAIWVDRRTSSTLSPLSGGIIRGRDAPESGSIIRGLLVEIEIKDRHFMRLFAKRRQTVKKPPGNQGRLMDIRSWTSHLGRLNATTSREWPKTRGMMIIGSVQFEC